VLLPQPPSAVTKQVWVVPLPKQYVSITVPSAGQKYGKYGKYGKNGGKNGGGVVVISSEYGDQLLKATAFSARTRYA